MDPSTGVIDLSDYRSQRHAIQRELEANGLSWLYNRGVTERAQMVRQEIFGSFANIRGDSYDQLRTKDVAIGSFFLCSSGLVEAMYQSYGEVVDELCKRTQTGKYQDETCKKEVGFRLATVVYSFGIAIHPWIDGNGQTFKATALSYLHELCPGTRNMFFPYRTMYDKYTNWLGLDMVNFAKYLPKQPIYTQAEQLRTIQALRYLVPGDEYGRGKWFEQVKELFPEVQNYSEARSKLIKEERRLLLVSYGTDWRDYEVGADEVSRQGMMNSYLEQLLNTDTGRQFIRSFVFSHPQENTFAVCNDYEAKAVKILFDTRKQLSFLLEHKILHELSFRTLYAPDLPGRKAIALIIAGMRRRRRKGKNRDM